MSHHHPNDRFVRVGAELLAQVDAFAERVERESGVVCTRAVATRALLQSALLSRRTAASAVRWVTSAVKDAPRRDVSHDPRLKARVQQAEDAICALARILEDHSRAIEVGALVVKNGNLAAHEDAWLKLKEFEEATR